MTEQGTSVAVIRDDALGHVDSLKTQLSLAIRANTPVICLACTNSDRLGQNCTVNADMQGAVRNSWDWGSGPETPLVEICPQFISVRAIH